MDHSATIAQIAGRAQLAALSNLKFKVLLHLSLAFGEVEENEMLVTLWWITFDLIEQLPDHEGALKMIEECVEELRRQRQPQS